MEKNINFKVFLVLFFLCGIAAILHIKAPSWDWNSYRYYNGWAFFNNRLDIDIMPALFRSYFNPLIDALFYLTIKYLNNYPVIFLLLHSLKFSVFLFLSYKIYLHIYKKKSTKVALVIYSLILTIFSPILILEFSFDSQDVLLGCGILATVYILIKNLYENSKNRNLFLTFAGLLLGCIAGLKYVFLIYCIAIFAIIILQHNKIFDLKKTLGLLTLNILIGFFLTDGYWLYIIWQKFSNPLFPYFNNIFKSPYADIENILHYDMNIVKPINFIEFITYPFLKYKGYEWRYFDLKFSLTYISIIIVTLFSFQINKNKDKIDYIINYNSSIFIILFTSTSYFVNLILFGQVRYLMPLYALASIIILFCIISLVQIFLHKYIYKTQLIYFILLIILIPLINSYELFTPKKHYNITKIKNVITTTSPNIEDNAIVLVASLPISYAIPSLNPNAKYIGLAIPEHLKEDLINKYKKIKNIYYISTPLENIDLKYANDAENLYFLVNSKKFIKDPDIYKNMVKYYSNKDLSSLKNCTNIDIKVFNENVNYGNAILCKLK